MAIEVKKSSDGKELIIYLDEQFDFAHHEDFREAYRNEPPGIRYRVNLAKARYFDSSALGMLLLLKKHAGGKAEVILEDIPGEIREVLEVANFQKLFTFR